MYVFTANFASQSLRKKFLIEIAFSGGLKNGGAHIQKGYMAVLIKKRFAFHSF